MEFTGEVTGEVPSCMLWTLERHTGDIDVVQETMKNCPPALQGYCSQIQGLGGDTRIGRIPFPDATFSYAG